MTDIAPVTLTHVVSLKELEKQDGDVVTRQSSIPTAASFPDGGREAWLVVMGGFVLSFCSFGYLNSFGVFLSYYKANMLSDYSESAISWIGTVQLFFMFGGGAMFAGRLFDMYGPRWLVLSGTIIMLFAEFMTSIATQYWQIFLAQALGFGLGISLCFYPTMGATNHFWFKRRGLAISIVVSGSSVGGVIWPIMLNNLFYRIGFGWSCRIVGFINIPLLIITNLTVKGRLPPREPGPFLDLSFYRDPRFCFLNIASFLTYLGNFIPVFLIQSLAAQKGLSTNQAFYILAVLNGSSFFGRLFPGRIADRIGYFNTAIPCVFVASLVNFASLAISSPAGIYVYAVVFGFASGSYVALSYNNPCLFKPANIFSGACTASICPDMRKIGTMQGMAAILTCVVSSFPCPPPSLSQN